MNIQFYVTEREAGKIAGKLECTTDKIGRILKASLLEQKTSPNFRELGEGKKEKPSIREEQKIVARWLKYFKEDPQAESMTKDLDVDPDEYLKFAQEVLPGIYSSE